MKAYDIDWVVDLDEAYATLDEMDYKNAAAPGAAIEMIHTFSLIHDDLPAMDDDDFRRGKPSCHQAFGEAMAILAGDALSVLPFGVISGDDKLSDSQKISIISHLARAVGKNGMIGGQVIDMENEERNDVDEANLRNMYRHKTGELVSVSCIMGCICAGELRHIRRLRRGHGDKRLAQGRWRGQGPHACAYRQKVRTASWCGTRAPG